jgi:probable HAF family extracellular repeat protein
LLESLEDRWLLSYQITDLGSLPGGNGESFANGINDSGQVVGLAFINNPHGHAFLWDAANGMQDLGTLPGDSFSDAIGINNSGQVVGCSYTTFTLRHAFLWDATSGMQDLGTLGGSFSCAFGINHSGQVVGYSAMANSSSHAFLWDASNGMQDLGILPGGTHSFAGGINDSGQVVGYSDTVGTRGFGHAFLWQNGAMTDLGTLPGDGDSYANGINNSGQVVGESRGDPSHAFLWDAVHGMQDLGTLGRNASAYGINSNGQVVGRSEVFDPSFGDYVDHAFVWQNGTMSDLNNLIPPGSGLTLFEATAINNAGQIVGGGIHNNQDRAFLLTPDSSAITAPARKVHFTSSDAPAVLLFGMRNTESGTRNAESPGSSFRTLHSEVRIDKATVPGTSDAAAPAGRTVQNATDALFARSHRTQAAIPSTGWETEGLELGLVSK